MVGRTKPRSSLSTGSEGNRLFNLEFMPATLNGRKGAKIGDRQVQSARKWNGLGLLSDEGLKAVEAVRLTTP